MSTANAFSVFPPPRVPRISVPSPSNRKPSLKTVGQVGDGKSPVVTVEELQISETPRTAKSLVYSPTLGTQGAISPHFKNVKIPPPPPRPSSMVASNYTSTTRASSSTHGSPEPESISSSETLVQPLTRGEFVVPIKSIFPVYDPSMPLSQQGFCPPRPTSIYDPRQYAADTSLMNSRNHGPSAVRSSYMPRANQDSIVEVPLDNLDFNEPAFSSSKELEKLWDATSSSSPLEAVASFDLEMTRLEEATFAFGSTPDAPFYSMTTYDTAEICLTKICPRKRTIACDVALASVEGMSRRMPPNDGLVSLILPKMAAMLAITQTDKLTEEYDLPSDDREELLEAAMKRATDQEASQLRWNPMDNRYELQHPAVSRKNRETNFVMSPLSPQGVTKPAIHISVVTSDTDRPVILVTLPGSARPVATSEAGDDNVPGAADVQLASLDFNSKTLHIEANAILEVMPSLFAVDSIIAAIAIVSVADENTNTVMGGMSIWTPKTSKANRTSMFEPASPPISGAFFATIAEREEAEEEARAAAKSHKKDKKNKAKASQFISIDERELDLEAGRTWYGKSKTKKTKQKKQIVISEFDLEKLTHYQSGARQGQELPAVTRGMLSVMNPLKMRLKAFRKHDD